MKPERKQRLIKVNEGMVVAVPARDGHGYLIGVVARAEKSRSLGAAALIYFFGPRWDSVPSRTQIDDINPRHPLVVLKTGVRRIREGQWPVIGDVENFDRAAWPIPIFGFFSEAIPEMARLVRYSGDRIGHGAPREEWCVPVEEARKYPRYSAHGVDSAAQVATLRLRELEALQRTERDRKKSD